MGPHTILRVRGGQPIEGGPSFDPVIKETFSDEDDFPEDRPSGDTTTTFRPHNMVLGPVRDESPQVVITSDPLSILNEKTETETETPDDDYIPKYTPQPYRPVRLTEPFESENFGITENIETYSREKINPIEIMEQADPESYQILVKDLMKTYIMGKVSVPVLKGVNLGVNEGEFLSIVGQSGSGKSTLLHLLGTLDLPDSGTIHFDGQRIDNITSGQRDVLRNRFIGMIFQFYHLLPELTTLENVLSPLMIRESVWGYFANRSRYHKRGEELLEQVGLSHRLKHKPNELSGGEMQRAAIARALISEPQILLADEPTGNLDAKNAGEILNLLKTLNKEKKLTIIMVTHDNSIAQAADRTVRIVDGKIENTYTY